jgi:hypothetical protein
MSKISVMKVHRKQEEENTNYNLHIVGVQEIRWETIISAVAM